MEEAVLNARQSDHAFDSVSFTPLSGPGEYQFTPGCSSANISAPGWGNVTPFTVSAPDYFPTATRPAVTDPEWLASLDEVRAYGASDSTVRTAEQLQIGLFYIELSLPSMNRLARQLVALVFRVMLWILKAPSRSGRSGTAFGMPTLRRRLVRNASSLGGQTC